MSRVHIEGVTHVTDMRTGAVDRIPLTDPLDWNARVEDPSRKPIPRDREVWIVTDDGLAAPVSYSEPPNFWLPKLLGPYFARTDGEPGTWGGDEIVAWTDSQEDAEEAGALLLRAAE